MSVKKISRTMLIAAAVGLFGMANVNAQEHMNSFQIVSNALENGKSLRQGQGLRSPNNQYAAVLQKDGNFCLYKLDPSAKYGNQFIKCTMTVGSEDKKGAILTMQQDGNLALYNSQNKHLWSTDTYRGGIEKQGWRLIMSDDGNLALVARADPGKNEKPIWEFQKGRLY